MPSTRRLSNRYQSSTGVFYGKVFYGKPGTPQDWELSPFPMGVQANEKRMPRWEDLSQWMKVMVATMVCHQWNDLLTFNIRLHPDLEKDLVADDRVRLGLRERVSKHLSRSLGLKREFFFVIEGHSKRSGGPTGLHIHGATPLPDRVGYEKAVDALAKATGHDIGGRGRTHAPFTMSGSGESRQPIPTTSSSSPSASITGSMRSAL